MIVKEDDCKQYDVDAGYCGMWEHENDERCECIDWYNFVLIVWVRHDVIDTSTYNCFS